MTAEKPAAPGNWQRWLRAFEVYRDRRQLVILAQGFSSGMPFLLSGSVLTYWMATEKVDLTTIGIFGLVGLPYALKFAWAPLVDRMPLPLIDRWLGRRRSWMLLTQVGKVETFLEKYPDGKLRARWSGGGNPAPT